MELLLSSQTEAKRVLDESAERAKSLLAKAGRQAAEQVMSQREAAARLLFEHHKLAVAVREHVCGVADEMSDAAGTKHLARHDRVAKLLLEDRERVAAELIAAEEELARHIEDKGTGKACAILMDGHRDAASILLEARSRAEENQTPR